MAEASAPVPPDLDTVIARTLCLGALVVRGTIESAIQLSPSSDDTDAYVSLANRLSAWLNEQDFTALFTAAELDALSQFPGAWNAAQHTAHASQMEGLGVLLWALSLNERLSPLNHPFGAPDLETLVGWPKSAVVNPSAPGLAAFPHNGATSLKGDAQLRAPAVIKGERVNADCWHWRAQVAALQRANSPSPNGQPYELMIAITAEEAHAGGAIPPPVKNDFALGGRPFRTLAEAEQLKIASLVNARRTALHWVSGYATEWDLLGSPAHLNPVAA